MSDEPAGQSVPVVRPEVWETYGPADLSAVPVFAGGFINFGYWQSVDLERPLSQGDRVRSEQDLYRHVLDAAGPGAAAPWRSAAVSVSGAPSPLRSTGRR